MIAQRARGVARPDSLAGLLLDLARVAVVIGCVPVLFVLLSAPSLACP